MPRRDLPPMRIFEGFEGRLWELVMAGYTIAPVHGMWVMSSGEQRKRFTLPIAKT